MIVKMFKKYITTLKLPKNKALNDYIQECVEIAKAHTGTLFFFALHLMSIFSYQTFSAYVQCKCSVYPRDLLI